MKWKNYVFIGFVVIVLIIIFRLFFLQIDSGITTSNEFVNKFNLVETSQDYSSVTYKGNYNNNILKIKKYADISEKNVNDYINERLFFLNSLYREINSPYPGQLSNKVKCGDEFTPIEVDNAPYNYFILYATERLTYGACSWDLIEYRSSLFFQYCENDGLYFIELFFPVEADSEQYESQLKQLSCPII